MRISILSFVPSWGGGELGREEGEGGWEGGGRKGKGKEKKPKKFFQRNGRKNSIFILSECFTHLCL